LEGGRRALEAANNVRHVTRERARH
jgi:hypothetical protein